MPTTPKLVPELDPQKSNKTTPSKFDLLAASRLREVVVRISNRRQSYRSSKWANEFRILRVEIQDDKVRLDSVLDYYEANAGKNNKLPTILSAAGFRQHFGWIENIMEKDIGEVQITPDARAIFSELSILRWPKGSDAQLPAEIQLSMKAYVGLKLRLEQLLESLPEKSSKWFAVENIFKRMATKRWFITRWYTRVWESVKNWDDWKGDLSRYRFSHESHDFTIMARQWCTEFSGRSNDWESWIIKEVVK